MRSKSILNFGQSIRHCDRRQDAGGSKPIIGWQGLEQGGGPPEEVDSLFSGLIIGIAPWLKGADTCAMLPKLVLPEAFVIPLVVFPVYLHEIQRRGI